MTPNRNLYHNRSNGLMNVAQRRNFQSDPRCNNAPKKIDEHTKHRLGSLIQEFIRYDTTCRHRKKETKYEKWLHNSSSTDRKKMLWEESEQKKPLILSILLSVVILLRAC